MKDGAAVGAVAVAGVPEWSEAGLVGSEGLPGDLCRLTQDDNHEGAHQVGCIRLLIEDVAAVMEQFNVFVTFISQYSAQLANVLVSVRQIQWAKVRVKRLVDQFLIEDE